MIGKEARRAAGEAATDFVPIVHRFTFFRLEQLCGVELSLCLLVVCVGRVEYS